MRRKISAEAIALHALRNIDSPMPAGLSFAAVAPHVLYQLGECLYSFPVLELELEQQRRDATADTSSGSGSSSKKSKPGVA